jgi:RHS repeat-associated protein
MTIKIKWIALLLTVSLAAVPLAAADGVPARYVVTIDASASPADVGALAARLAREYGGRLEPYAEEGFSGFAIILTPQRAQLLSGDPRIASIREQRDAFTTVAPEVIQAAAKTTLRPMANAGATLSFGTYTYDPSGNIHKIVGSVGTETFLYDPYARLTSGTHAMPSPQTPVAQQYTYDRYGNIETIKTTGQPDRILAVDKSSNKLDSTTVAGANVKGTYDGAGNQVTLNREGILGTFVYDGLNFVKESTIAGSRRIYIYSASDERLASFEGVTDFGTTGKQQWTVRDPGGQVLRRFTRATQSAPLQWDEDYFYRSGQMLAAYVPGPEKVRHFFPDHLGTPRLVTGNGGAQIAEHRYYAFGEELTPRIAGAEQKKFTGHERDSVDNAPGADIDYMHARYYGTREGRFLSADPTWQSADAGDPQSWNRYTYAGNNPVLTTDPDGRLAFVPVIMGVLWVVDKAYAAYEAHQDYKAIKSGKTTLQEVAQRRALEASLGMAMGAVGRIGGKAATKIISKAADDVPIPTGTIYRVPGEATSSGKPYIGRHNKPNPAETRKSKDGRDRTKAEVVDTYDPSNTTEGRIKEQTAIDAGGGIDNLDNKRNEIAPKKWERIRKNDD